MPAPREGYKLPGVRGLRVQAVRDKMAMLKYTRQILTTTIAYR